MSRSFLIADPDYSYVLATPVASYPLALGCWVYPTLVNGTEQVFYGCGTDAGGGISLEIFTDNTFTLLVNGIVRKSSGITPTPNNWYYVATECSSAGGSLFVWDGTTFTNPSFSFFPHNPVTGISIGTQINAATPTFQRYFQGRIAQAGLWNSLLGSNITTLYTGAVDGTTVLPANLQGYWRLCGTVSPEPDSSSNNNSLTLVGPPTLSSDPSVVTGCSTSPPQPYLWPYMAK